MPNIKTNLLFKGTYEQEVKLMKIIKNYEENYEEQDNSLMKILTDTRELYGYLPIEVQAIIAQKLCLSLAEVYQFVALHPEFARIPKGENRISVCLGSACCASGASEILKSIEEFLGIKDGETTSDGKFSLDATKCIGSCSMAPVIVINDDIYGKVVANDIPEILNKYICLTEKS